MSQWPAGASGSARPGKPVYSCSHYLASTSPCTDPKCRPQTSSKAGGA